MKNVPPSDIVIILVASFGIYAAIANLIHILSDKYGLIWYHYSADGGDIPTKVYPFIWLFIVIWAFLISKLIDAWYKNKHMNK